MLVFCCYNEGMIEVLPQLITNSLIAASIYALTALGFNLAFSTTKFFDLGYGGIAAVGGYLVFWLSKQLEVNTSLSIVISLLACGVVGLLINRFVYQPLRDKKSSNMVMLVASLGILTVLQAILAMAFSSQFQTLSKGFSEDSLNKLAGAVITDTQVAIISTVGIITIGLYFLLTKTKLGKAIRAVGDDPQVAEIVGIPAKKIVSIVFVIGSIIAGLSGILIGFDTGIEPTMGLNLLLKGVIVAIIGGIGNVFAAIVGGLLLGFAENFGVWFISGEWKDAIAFGVLILFLLFKPNGLLVKSKNS